VSEEQTTIEVEQIEEPEEARAEEHETVTEEFKVQAEDLFKTINDIIRQGTARRVVVTRNDRVLVDIPLVAGVAASVVFAMYMPILSALVGVGALFGGCTVRVERGEGDEFEA
jgi:hypothetical protein